MTTKKTVHKQALDEAQFLAGYDAGQYDHPSVSVDMLVFTVRDEEQNSYRKLPEKALQILLIKRAEHPCKGQWALPGGFVSIKEDLEEAVQRQLKKETGIDQLYMEQLYTWGEVARDPRTRVISVSYMSLADSSQLKLQPSEDTADARWFTVRSKLFQEQKTHTEQGCLSEQIYKLMLTAEDITLTASVKVVKTLAGKVQRIERSILESDGLAFDHAKIIDYGIERLRNKIEYTDIAFNLMPDLFTLTELQQVYEIILDTELLKANFRRKISDRVTETNEYTKDAGHRPSKLFRYNSGL